MSFLTNIFKKGESKKEKRTGIVFIADGECVYARVDSNGLTILHSFTFSVSPITMSKTMTKIKKYYIKFFVPDDIMNVDVMFLAIDKTKYRSVWDMDYNSSHEHQGIINYLDVSKGDINNIKCVAEIAKAFNKMNDEIYEKLNIFVSATLTPKRARTIFI